MTAYVAPAAKVFTVAHIPSSEVPEEEGGAGQTVCGLVMDPLEFWLPVSLRLGEKACAGCTDPQSGTEEQGCLL